MTALPARYAEGELAIAVVQGEGEVRLVWAGRSADRDPARFLQPVFAEVLEKVRGDLGRLVMDFTSLDYMNSSTFAPIVKLIEEVKRSGASLVLEYDGGRRWQELSFSALRTFETPDGRIRVRSR